MAEVMIGIGPHKSSHTAVAIGLGEEPLGELQAARDLAQDTLQRRRRVLGEDHPSALLSAADLRALGEADDNL